MSINSLPPELLAQIFAHALPHHPVPARDPYLDRNHTLLSISLVNRRWTPIAQRLLSREIWVGVGDDELELKARQLAENSSQFALSTKSLTVGGNLELFVNITGHGMWDQVTSIEHSNPSNCQLDLSVFSGFPQLRSLRIYEGEYILPAGSRPLVLPRLSRFGFSIIYVDPNDRLRHLISLRSMPVLKHLALDVDRYYQSDLLHCLFDVAPQLETLALLESYNSIWEDDFVACAARLQSLKHISLDLYPAHWDYLFDVLSAGLRLESIHLPSSVLTSNPHIATRLVEVATGGEETAGPKRVVLWGSRSKAEEEYPDWDLGGFEWRQDDDGPIPPFMEFDGE